MIGSIDNNNTYTQDAFPAVPSFTYRSVPGGSPAFGRAYNALPSDGTAATFAVGQSDKLFLADYGGAGTFDYTWAALSPDGAFGLYSENYWGNTFSAMGGEGMPTTVADWTGTGDTSNPGAGVRPYNQVDGSGNWTGLVYGPFGVTGRNRWNSTRYRVYKMTGAVGARTNAFLETDATYPTYGNGGLGDAAMMLPAFSPDGKKLVFINGDMAADAGGVNRSAWRRGLSTFNVAPDAVSGYPVFGSRKLVFDNFKNDPVQSAWPGSRTPVQRPEVFFPSFEGDSRMIVFQGVEANAPFAGHAYQFDYTQASSGPFLGATRPHMKLSDCNGNPVGFLGDTRSAGFPDNTGMTVSAGCTNSGSADVSYNYYKACLCT